MRRVRPQVAPHKIAIGRRQQPLRLPIQVCEVLVSIQVEHGVGSRFEDLLELGGHNLLSRSALESPVITRMALPVCLAFSLDEIHGETREKALGGGGKRIRMSKRARRRSWTLAALKREMVCLRTRMHLSAMPSTAISAGLLMFRKRGQELEFFLVHPGGPFFAKKDANSWTVPKGLVEAGEDLLSAAQREFTEETGFVPSPPFYELGSVRQKSGKVTHVWAFEGDDNPSQLVSNTCEIIWPPRSGKKLIIPEVDRGDWFDLDGARSKVREEQGVLLDTLLMRVKE